MTKFYPSNLQWVGIAKETSYGVAEAAPTTWIPVESPSYKSTITPLKDKNLRGAMAETYQQQQGLRHDELTYKTYFYTDSVYQHFLAILGNPDTVSGSADPYTHETSLYNGDGSNSAQPASFTLFWADATGNTQKIPGAIPSSVKVTLGADALASIDVTWIGLPATSIAAPLNTPADIKPMPSWSSDILVGGTASSAYSNIELTIKRATEIIPTITGTQSPFAIFGGPVDVTGSLTAVFQNVEEDVNWTNYLSNTQPAIVVVVKSPEDNNHFAAFQMSKVAYDISEVSGSNKWQEIKATVQALANATDALSGNYSPILVAVQNATSTAY